MIRNSAIFLGTIVALRGNDTSGTITLACPGIARARQEGKLVNVVRENYPVVIYNSKTETKKIASLFKKQERVIVYAKAQTRIRVDERGNTTEFVNFYVEEMERVHSKMEDVFGAPGTIFAEPRNEMYLGGKIAGITRRTETVIQLRLDLTEDRKNMINLTLFRAPADFTDKFHIDDEVNVFAMVQTSNTRENKVVRGYHEVIALDIAPQGSRSKPISEIAQRAGDEQPFPA